MILTERHRQGSHLRSHFSSLVSVRDAPPAFIEYGFYLWLFYNIFGPVLGISGDLLGAAAVAVLAGYCIVRLETHALQVYKPLRLPLAFGISFIITQVFIHDEPLMEGDLRSFVPWMFILVLVYSLSLRTGFQRRFSWAALLLGLCLVPYLNVQPNGTVERAGLQAGIGLANPNDLAAWFGFLSVYFAVRGLNSLGNVSRIISYAIAIGSLFVVALTVSRSPILAVGISLVIASRNFLKRGFVPLLILAVSVWAVYESGVFDKYVAEYVERGTEETGRLVIWPLVVERIINSPVTGVGMSEIGTYTPQSEHPITPHNNFLLVGLASGIVPLMLFVGYWYRAAQGTFRSINLIHGDSIFQLPLFVYAFLQAQVLNFTFMLPWVIVVLSEGLRAGSHQQNIQTARFNEVRPLHNQRKDDQFHERSRNARYGSRGKFGEAHRQRL